MISRGARSGSCVRNPWLAIDAATTTDPTKVGAPTDAEGAE